MADDYGLRFDMFADWNRWQTTQESLEAALEAIRPLVAREGGVVIARPSVCAVCGAEYPEWVDFYTTSDTARRDFAVHCRPMLGALYGLCKACAARFHHDREAAKVDVFAAVCIWLCECMDQGCREPVDILELRDGAFTRLPARTRH